MAENYIAIGDIHGCPEQLEEILELTSGYRSHRYVFLGDYIDRGPDSQAVIEMLRKLDAVFLLGNHDADLLGQTRNRVSGHYGDSFLGTKITEESFDWLQHVPVPIFESEDYIFVHAGLNRGKDLRSQTLHDYLWTREQGDYGALTSKTVIHGHTIVPAPVTIGNRININTGCGAKGYLTALMVPEMRFFRSSQSPGMELDWEELRREVARDLEWSCEPGVLEELD